MRCRTIVLGAVFLVAALSPGSAGMRTPGKYCGVVVFDRWDACYLYSGVYLMYVSEKVKEDLRPYAGEAVQVDAYVWQPMNPGDGLIRRYTVLGPAPDDDWLGPLTGLELCADMRVVSGRPEFRVRLKNNSAKTITIHADHLAPTLLMRAPAQVYPWTVGDGPSEAALTRTEMYSLGAWWVIDGKKMHWRVTSERLKPFTELAPGQKMATTLLFNLPPGEYEFLCGYGGGVHQTMCVASNLVPFDVDATRTAHEVQTTH